MSEGLLEWIFDVMLMTQFEAVYPPTAVPLGFIKGEPIYARECVKNLHSRETWLKEAKVVRVSPFFCVPFYSTLTRYNR